MSAFTVPAVAASPIPIFRRSRSSIQDKETVAIQTRLQKSGYPALRHLQVVVRGGVVVLQGSVDSYFLKQMAQEAIRPLAIGRQITNEVRVRMRAP